MKIDIRERFRPFTHQAGHLLWLPQTSLTLRLFPSRLEVRDLNTPFYSSLPPEVEGVTFDTGFEAEFEARSGAKGALVAVISLGIQPPLAQFSATLDLERGWIEVSLQTASGFFRYRLEASSQGMTLAMAKASSPLNYRVHIVNSLWRAGGKMEGALSRQDQLTLLSECPTPLLKKERGLFSRLYLGCSKKQEWEGISSRLDIKELFPLWQRLSQWVPAVPLVADGGTLDLLNQVDLALLARRHDEVERLFVESFKAAFLTPTHFFVPSLLDGSYFGYSFPQVKAELALGALSLLTVGAKWIERLFVETTDDTLILLPHLLSAFPSGRLIDLPVSLKSGWSGVVSLEWSRYRLRKLQLKTEKEGEVQIASSPPIRSFRQLIDHKKCCLFSRNHKIYCKLGKQQNFDRFEY